MCSDSDMYSVQHMNMLWFGDKSGFGVAWHKNADRENMRTQPNQISTVYHDVSVGNWAPSGNSEGLWCVIRLSRGLNQCI